MTKEINQKKKQNPLNFMDLIINSAASYQLLTTFLKSYGLLKKS